MSASNVKAFPEVLSPQDGKAGGHEFKIRNFRSERYTLADDLNLYLEEHDGQCVVSSYDTGQFGHGYSPDQAIENLCSVVEEYYALLVEDEGHLSPRLDSHLRYLRTVLRLRQ